MKLFELDINVATVKKVYASGAGQLRIDVGADTLDQNGAGEAGGRDLRGEVLDGQRRPRLDHLCVEAVRT